MHQSFYINNKRYSKFLESQLENTFDKYVDQISRHIKSNSNLFLDIGCGTGIALKKICNMARCKTVGVEISKTSIQICKKKNLQVSLYNGRNLDFNNEVFDVVGSYNVLEHTENPVCFLDESIRVLKKQGYLLVVCPNFLSITNNYHYRTRGMIRKIRNLGLIFRKLFLQNLHFEKMKAVETYELFPDCDAINLTNPIDIIKWGKVNNMKLIYWSGSSIYESSFIKRIIDLPVIRLFLGSSFIIFQK
jgi:SAM-dependent methyltransferase